MNIEAKKKWKQVVDSRESDMSEKVCDLGSKTENLVIKQTLTATSHMSRHLAMNQFFQPHNAYHEKCVE